jgi:hypothetical protein
MYPKQTHLTYGDFFDQRHRAHSEQAFLSEILEI